MEEYLELGSGEKAKKNQTIQVKKPTCKSGTWGTRTQLRKNCQRPSHSPYADTNKEGYVFVKNATTPEV
jgi:hypothetical protein